jgi:glutathione S-transferase
MSAQPLEIWFWPTPNGRKITIACEEMAVPYVLKPVDIGRGEQFTPEFLAISPNNRMPAVVDPQGPDGKPISVFESGAILQYLGRKTGKFYPADERGRVEVDEWLFWQMAGLGPMAGQAHHFRGYAPAMFPDSRITAYGAARYTNEVNRLYGVLDHRLKGRDFVAGDYSIADMAIWPWVKPWKAQGQDLDEFPELKAWFARIEARPKVQAAMAAGEEVRRTLADNTKEAEEARKVLFGQRARRRA